MDGISNLVGRKSVTRTFNGREYRFSLKVLADHAEKEAYILSLKPSPFDVLATLPDSLNPDARAVIEERLTKEALRPQFVTREQEVDFDCSLHGLAWGLWRSLRDNEHDFGKLKDGEMAVFETPLGVGYSLTPEQGIQRTLDFIEEVGDERVAELHDIRDGVESPPELKNSSGSGTTNQTPSPAGTDASPGPKSSDT